MSSMNGVDSVRVPRRIPKISEARIIDTDPRRDVATPLIKLLQQWKVLPVSPSQVCCFCSGHLSTLLQRNTGQTVLEGYKPRALGARYCAGSSRCCHCIPAGILSWTAKHACDHRRDRGQRMMHSSQVVWSRLLCGSHTDCFSHPRADSSKTLMPVEFLWRKQSRCRLYWESSLYIPVGLASRQRMVLYSTHTQYMRGFRPPSPSAYSAIPNFIPHETGRSDGLVRLIDEVST